MTLFRYANSLGGRPPTPKALEADESTSHSSQFSAGVVRHADGNKGSFGAPFCFGDLVQNDVRKREDKSASPLARLAKRYGNGP